MQHSLKLIIVVWVSAALTFAYVRLWKKMSPVAAVVAAAITVAIAIAVAAATVECREQGVRWRWRWKS